MRTSIFAGCIFITSALHKFGDWDFSKTDRQGMLILFSVFIVMDVWEFLNKQIKKSE